MLRTSTGCKIAGWLLLVAWLPVFIQSFSARFFGLEEKFPMTGYLVIGYEFWLAGPLTAMAAIAALYAGLTWLRRKEFKLPE